MRLCAWLLCKISSISICSASARRSVSSYPWICSSIGSPIGASFTMVTSAPGIIPISRKCWRSAPVPPTLRITALFPICSSFNVIFSCSLSRSQRHLPPRCRNCFVSVYHSFVHMKRHDRLFFKNISHGSPLFPLICISCCKCRSSVKASKAVFALCHSRACAKKSAVPCAHELEFRIWFLFFRGRSAQCFAALQ